MREKSVSKMYYSNINFFDLYVPTMSFHSDKTCIANTSICIHN